MIKDKITPELKKRFLEDIIKTKASGNERGFFLCENEERKLFAAQSCEGTDCNIRLGDPRKGCPSETKNQGEFHTHPYMFGAKLELKKRRQKIPSDGELRSFMDKNIREVHEKITKVKGVTMDTPSYTDVLMALLNKYTGMTGGTTCTASDAGDHKVECWTIKDLPKDKLKELATIGMRELDKVKHEGSQTTKKWIDNIFDREIIYLNRNRNI